MELKGRVACEISSADELTLTELMFNGVLKEITVEEMVSLLSCFVWQEKLQNATKPREELDLLFAQLQDTARKVAKVQLECKVIMEVLGIVHCSKFKINFNNIVTHLKEFATQFRLF